MMEPNLSQRGAEVTVSDPKNFGEGRGNRYTAYLVEVLNPNSRTKTEVRRRYSDFQWLYQRLMLERPGAIVPIIPHKQAVRDSVRFSDELLTERTQALQRFLTIVVSHPELFDSASLKTFVTAFNEDFEKVKNETTQSVNYSPASCEATGFLGKVKAKLAVASGVGELERTPDDATMETMEEYLQNLDTYIKIVAREATAIVKQNQEAAKSLQGMGDAFASLGEKPFPQAYTDAVGELATNLSEPLRGVGVIVEQESKQAALKLDEPMQELARDVQAAKLALQRRKEIAWDYTRRVQALNKKKSLRAKHQATEQEVIEATKEAKESLKQVQGASKRVQRETDRFHDDVQAKLRQLFQNYTQLEVNCHKHLEAKWAEIVPLVASNDGEAEIPVHENGVVHENGGTDAPMENGGDKIPGENGGEESQQTDDFLN